MSGAQTSGFANQNDLMTVATQNIANYYAPEKNRLLIETAKQEQGGREMEAMSRFASGLLDPAAYPTPEARAAAYGPGIQYLQSLGFAKNAPATYPGDDVAHRLASMGIPAEKQWEQQGVQRGADQFRQSLTGATPAAGTPAVPGASTSPATPGVLPPEPDLAHIVAPGGARLSVAAPYADRFQGLVNDLEAAGYKIDPGQTGGYNRRFIAGTNTPSEHASGAAVDINWTNNARGTKGEIDPDLARKLAAKWGLTWGGDWSGDTRDPMHFEVAGANRSPVRPTAVASAAPAVPAVPAVPAAPPNRLLPPVGGGPPGGGMVGIDKPMSGGTPDVLGALEPEQPAPTQFAGPGVPLPPPTSTTGGFVGPGLEGGPAGNVLGGLTSVAPAAPAVPAAPAPVAPAPAPSVLPPLPTAPKPLIGNSGLTADQIQTLHGESLNARTPQQVAKLYADRQTYLQQNDTARKEYEAAVYARAEKAEADKARAVTQQLAMETNMRGWKNDQREQEKADREQMAANLPYPGKDKESAQKNILWKGNQPGGDTSTKEYADAYQALKYQTAPNGSIIIRDMPWAPPTGKGAETMKPPTFIAQPSDTARNEVRKADNDAILISRAIDNYTELFAKSGKSSWDAFWNNPTSPEAQELLGAFDVMKTALRSPIYANTGVLQPAEMKMLQEELVSPSTLRGLYATPEAMKARLHQIKFAIISRQDQELRSIGQPGSIVRNDKEFEAVEPGAFFYDKNGNKRQKPEAP